MRPILWREELYAHSALGRTKTAVSGARELAVHAKTDACLPCANCAINIFIERGWQGPSNPPEPSAAREWALVRVNLVEAVYNLGGWEAASARLSKLEETACR